MNKIERDIEEAKKDLAILNIDYLKRKSQIDEFILEKENEAKKLELEYQLSRSYML
jgi:hypothetical protein